MAYNFDGKSVIVTGGASGIGRATAKRFGTEGANVVVADIDVTGGQETARRIESAGGKATFIETDVTSATAVEEMVRETVDTYGSVDVAHNNAGVGGDDSRMADQTEDHWDAVTDVNLKGVWLCLKYELAVMAKNGGGAVVNTASIAGLAAVGHTAYAVSKHGVVGLTRVAAAEYATDDVRVNAICPGVVDTPMTNPDGEDTLAASDPVVDMQLLKRLATPNEIANAVVWLASEEASFITGSAYPVDGGYMTR